MGHFNYRELATLNHYLASHGLATLDDPGGLIPQLAFLVEDDDHLKRLLIKCEPERRHDMYEALRPHLGFEPKTLDVYVAEAGAAAEAQQLPTIGADGKLYPFRAQDIRTIERVVDEALSGFHLSVTCRKCTKAATFHGHTKYSAVYKLRQAGWTWDEIRGDGLEICPDCPAVRD